MLTTAWLALIGLQDPFLDDSARSWSVGLKVVQSNEVPSGSWIEHWPDECAYAVEQGPEGLEVRFSDSDGYVFPQVHLVLARPAPGSDPPRARRSVPARYPPSMPESPLYFRQLLAGRDIAARDPVARQMVNFVYLIGDRRTGKCVVVDPAWSVDDVLRRAAEDDMEIEGVLATHHHPDHVGGDLFGTSIPGVKDLLEKAAVRIHCHRAESDWIRRTAGVSASDIVAHESGDVVNVGDVRITLIHSPGHTPGSQCYLVDQKLVSGDTLFLQGCGRTDFPGGDADEMYRSLTQRLAKIPDDTVLYPGHLYDPRPFASLGETRRTNYVLQVPDLERWRELT